VGLATRPNDAAQMRQAHHDLPGMSQAADDFDRAAAAYQAAHNFVRADTPAGTARREVARQLRQAAGAELDADQRFLAHDAAIG